MSDSTPSLPHAGVLRRLIALIYDAFLLFGLLVVPLFLFTALNNRGAGIPEQGVVHELPPIAPAPILFAYTVCVIAGFYFFFWRKTGQTLGMQAWRMRVVSRDGGRPSWRQCAVRAAVGIGSLGLFGLGYWWLLIDRDRLTWHDRASNTKVIVLPKP